MRRAAYTVLFALIACVLVGTLHAQDGNLLKEEVREIQSFYKRLYAVGEDLEQNSDYSSREITKDEWCRLELLSTLWISMSNAEAVIAISSEIQPKADKAIVNDRLKPMIGRALVLLNLCVQKPMGHGEPCPSNVYITNKASEIAKLCSNGIVLLRSLLRRVDYW